MLPLYGGGFWVALLQATCVYYAAAIVLHYLVPALFPVKSIQKGDRQPRQVAREACSSLGGWLLSWCVFLVVGRVVVVGGAAAVLNATADLITFALICHCHPHSIPTHCLSP